jgi:UDP-glucuronate 4-epimerase
MMCVNFGSGNPLSLNTLIQTICDVTGLVIQRNELELQAGDVRATFADNSKAKELLGWKPKWSLKDGIAETVKWFKETELEVEK